MITQIIINEAVDLGMTNNWGQPEPFQDDVRKQIFGNVPYEYIDKRLSYRKMRNHMRNEWRSVPMFSLRLVDQMLLAMLPKFDNLKNNF